MRELNRDRVSYLTKLLTEAYQFQSMMSKITGVSYIVNRLRLHSMYREELVRIWETLRPFPLANGQDTFLLHKSGTKILDTGSSAYRWMNHNMTLRAHGR